MDGMEVAAQLLADRLEAQLPAKTAELRARLSVTEPTDLPDVASVTPHELGYITLEAWPAVMVVGQNLEQMTRDEIDPTGTTWLCTYRMRVFTWARGDDFPQTTRVRYRLVLAVREVLMQLRRINATAQVDERPLAEAYSDLEVDDAGATIGGAWTEFLIVMQERLDSVPAKGTADDVVLDTGTLPPHPAL